MSREDPDTVRRTLSAPTAWASLDRFGPLLWAFLGLALCALVIPLEPNLLEEGLILEIAQRLVA